MYIRVILCWSFVTLIFVSNPTIGQDRTCKSLSDEFSAVPKSMDSLSLMNLAFCVNAELKNRMESEGIATLETGQMIAETVGEVSDNGCGGVDPLLECIEINDPDGVDPLLVPGNKPWLLGDLYEGNMVWIVDENSNGTVFTVDSVDYMKLTVQPFLESFKSDRIYEVPLGENAGKLYMSGDSFTADVLGQ